MENRIILIDDDSHILNYMQEHLSLNDFNVQAFQSPKDALKIIDDFKPQLVITDVKMDEMTGDEVINYVRNNHPKIGVILITGFGNINHSVRAMQKGAFDYITKPFSGREFISRINQYFSSTEVNHLNNQQSAIKTPRPEGKKRASATINHNKKYNLIGNHPKIKKLLEIIPQIAPTNAPVLIQGDSGTGKEVLAGLIHENSTRSNQPFIKINCANLPKELVESTLFGHVKGAFTGAINDQDGAFHEADNGTLLLDEITEIDINTQAKLLRVLQEKEFQKVGSQKPQKVNVRIIATTNRNVAEVIQEGEFRNDLYFRLNVFPVRMPSLNERIEDIAALADHFCNKYTREYGLGEKSISEALLDYLENKEWSGNVRELENYIQRGVIMSKGDELIEKKHTENPLFQNLDPTFANDTVGEIPILPIEEMELILIKKALERTNGNQKEASKLLKISDRTIRNKLKNIDFPDNT